MRLKIKRAFLLLLVLLLPVITKAAAYWLSVTGNGNVNSPVSIKLYYGSINDYGVRIPDTGRELKLAGDFNFYILDANGNRTDISLVMQKDCWQGSFTPRAEGTYRIFGQNAKHPVVDRSASGGINVLPVDYICADYLTGKTNLGLKTDAAPQLDIIVKPEGKLLSVTAYVKGEPCKAGTKLRVFNPDNWEKELILDEHGSAKLFPIIKGLYIIRLDVDEAAPGSYLGVAYQRIRHRCNYFLQY